MRMERIGRRGPEPLERELLRPLWEYVEMNHHYAKPRLLDKARAAWRRECGKDPSLPPLLHLAGEVEVEDAIRVILPTVAGVAIYRAIPGRWRFELVGATVAAAPAEFNGNSSPAVARPAAKFAAKCAVQVEHHIDALLDLLGDLDSRAELVGRTGY